MAARAFVIFAGERHWHVGVLDGHAPRVVGVVMHARRGDSAGGAGGDRDGSAAGDNDSTYTYTQAAAVRQCADALGYRGQGVMLAAPSAWCLCAAVDTVGLTASGARRRQALLYRLEEKLPAAAEDLTADFTAPLGGRCLGVCSPTDRLLAVVDALESAGVAVQSICPTALLALSDCLHSSPLRGEVGRGAEPGGVCESEHAREESNAGPSPNLSLAGRGAGLARMYETATSSPLPRGEVGRGADRSCAPGATRAPDTADVPIAPDVVMLSDDADNDHSTAGAIDLFVMDGGRPVTWRHLPADAADVAMHLRWHWHGLDHAAPLRLAAIGVDPALVDEAADRSGAQLITSASASASPTAALSQSASGYADTWPPYRAVLAAGAILSGRQSPWIDLRRGALAGRDPLQRVRRPLTWAVAAAVLLCLSLAATALWRAAQYGQVIDAALRRQQATFTEAFADQAPPPAVRLRLESELRKVQGTSGQSAPRPRTPAVLTLLHDALAPLPRDVRWRLLELRLDERSLYLDGEARAHGDADALAAALRRGAVFQVQPPRTEKLADRGVSFTITAAVAHESAPTQLASP